MGNLALALRGYAQSAPSLMRDDMAAAADAVEECARLRAERDEAQRIAAQLRTESDAYTEAGVPWPNSVRKAWDAAMNERDAVCRAKTGGQEMMRPCTCNPKDNPPVPCQHKYALTHCLLAEAQEAMETINKWCCYATEEDPSAKLTALQQIGVLARAVIRSSHNP